MYILCNRNVVEQLNKEARTFAFNATYYEAFGILKVFDILFAQHSTKWIYTRFIFYRKSLNCISQKINYKGIELGAKLHGLSPKTYSEVLINARHITGNELEIAIIRYKEENDQVYACDRSLRINFITNERKARQHINSRKSKQLDYCLTEHSNQSVKNDDNINTNSGFVLALPKSGKLVNNKIIENLKEMANVHEVQTTDDHTKAYQTTIMQVLEYLQDLQMVDPEAYQQMMQQPLLKDFASVDFNHTVKK